MTSLDETLKALDEILQVTSVATSLPYLPPPPVELYPTSNDSIMTSSDTFNWNLHSPSLLLTNHNDLKSLLAVEELEDGRSALSPVPSFTSMGSEEVRKSLDELDAVIEAFDHEYQEMKNQFQMNESMHENDGTLKRTITPTGVPNGHGIPGTNEDIDAEDIPFTTILRRPDPDENKDKDNCPLDHTQLPPPAPYIDETLETHSSFMQDDMMADSMDQRPRSRTQDSTREKPPPPKRSPHTKLTIVTQTNSSVSNINVDPDSAKSTTSDDSAISSCISDICNESNDLTTLKISNTNDTRASPVSSETESDSKIISSEIDTASRSVSDILKQFSSLKATESKPVEVTSKKAPVKISTKSINKITPSQSMKESNNINYSTPVDLPQTRINVQSTAMEISSQLFQKDHHPPKNEQEVSKLGGFSYVKTLGSNDKGRENIYSVPSVNLLQRPTIPLGISAPFLPPPPPPPPPPPSFQSFSSPVLEPALSSFSPNPNQKRRSGPPPAPPKRTVSAKTAPLETFCPTVKSTIYTAPNTTIASANRSLVQEATPPAAMASPTRKIVFSSSQGPAPSTVASNVKTPTSGKKHSTDENVLHSAMVNQLRNGVQLKKVPSITEADTINGIEGFVRIPDNCPEWKRVILEKKNKEILENIKKQQEEEEKERRKWEGVPDWKRHLLESKMKKAEDDQQKSICDDKMKSNEEDERVSGLPNWKKNLCMKKRNGMETGSVSAGISG